MFFNIGLWVRCREIRSNDQDSTHFVQARSEENRGIRALGSHYFRV